MARPQSEARPQKRNGYWHYVRRVPREYRSVEPREIVVLSTGIPIVDDPRAVQAARAVRAMDNELFRVLRDKRAGRDPGILTTYRKARDTAATLGLSYLEQRDVKLLTLDKLVERLERLTPEPKGERDRETFVAVTGLTPQPGAMLSEIITEAERHLASAHAKKSERPKYKWRKPREYALDIFIKVIGGDKPIKDVTRAEVILVRNHWQDRVLKEGIALDTANKNITRVGALYNVINEMDQLNLPPIFQGVTIKGKGGKRWKKRIPYDVGFIQDKFLAEGMFNGLNDDARHIIYLLIETGVRLSEAANLDERTIHLDHEIPHIRVLDLEREVKTEQSIRSVPLVGVALEAMQLHPKGFPRYRDKEDSLSALLNEALTSRKLRPGGKMQTIYSLRHSFSDRLRKVGCDGTIIDKMMGHAPKGMDYGEVADLELKRDWISKIALKPPRRL